MYDNSTDLHANHHPCASFYMNKEQIDRVNNWTEPKEFLAENGYRIDEADPDKDTDIIHKRWRHGKPGYENDTR